DGREAGRPERPQVERCAADEPGGAAQREQERDQRRAETPHLRGAFSRRCRRRDRQPEAGEPDAEERTAPLVHAEHHRLEAVLLERLHDLGGGVTCARECRGELGVHRLDAARRRDAECVLARDVQAVLEAPERVEGAVVLEPRRLGGEALEVAQRAGEPAPQSPDLRGVTLPDATRRCHQPPCYSSAIEYDRAPCGRGVLCSWSRTMPPCGCSVGSTSSSSRSRSVRPARSPRPAPRWRQSAPRSSSSTSTSTGRRPTCSSRSCGATRSRWSSSPAAPTSGSTATAQTKCLRSPSSTVRWWRA